MSKFTFLGSNTSGYVEYGGYRFETGKAAEVKDSKENADLIRRLSDNQEFKSAGKKAEDMIDPHNVPAASEEALAESAKPKLSIKS